MASNFRIMIQRCNGILRLELSGDFDGSSAHEVINTIYATASDSHGVVINTDGLREIHPFGKAVFEKLLTDVKSRFDKFVFSGAFKEAIYS